MSSSTLLLGPNLSGRSQWLADRRALGHWPNLGFVGPYPDAASTGLAWTVDEEMILANKELPTEDPFIADLDITELAERELHTLSGGEGVRVALATTLLRRPQEIQIDIALEHLDPAWRKVAFKCLIAARRAWKTDVYVADNRITAFESDRFERQLPFPLSHDLSSSPLTLRVSEITARLTKRQTVPMEIAIHDLTFRYPRSRSTIFSHTSTKFDPGQLYFLSGPNGSGKTTLVKLLCGTLLPQTGAVKFGGKKFEPRRSSQRYVAVAFQAPDYQWTDIFVRGEFARTLHEPVPHAGQLLAIFGIPEWALDHQTVELPFVIKKRLGLAIAFLYGKPWLVLDEPTLGQDISFRRELASLIGQLLERRAGIVVITHDEEFKSWFPDALTVTIANRTIIFD